MVQAFRRPESGEEIRTFKLRGLDPEATYELEVFDGGKETRTGRELLDEGITVPLREKPSTAVITYKQLTNPGKLNG